MTAFDFDACVRWSKAFQMQAVARRPDDSLPFVSEREIAGPPLLLDTCVYIDRLRGRAPRLLDDIVEKRRANHSTVVIQEMMHTVGVLAPGDPRTAGAIVAIRELFRAMRPHRIYAPDADVLGRAAMLAGTLCRLQGYSKDDKLRAVQDCVLFLQAWKLGLTLLTANIGDFDNLMQLTGTGRVLFYRNA